MLPSHPLFGDRVVVRLDGEAEAVLRVVVAGEVAQDGEPLKDGEAAAVVVDDGRDAAVGVEGRVPGLLLRVLGDVDGLVGVRGAVGFLELLEEDRGLDAVGGAWRSGLVVGCQKKGGDANRRSRARCRIWR